jgi:hypothetical protein
MTSSGSGPWRAFASSQGAHPYVSLFVGRHDHRHRLRVHQLNHRVRRGRQESIDKVRTGYRLGLGSKVALEVRPHARERRQWPVFIESEPDDVLFLCFRVGLRAYSAKLLKGTSGLKMKCDFQLARRIMFS